MKDSFYFQHDYNARNDERILQIRAEHGLAGYALYFMLLESMAESSDGYLNIDGMAGLSLSYGSAIEQLKALVSRCIELGLFHEVKGRFSSKRMVEYKDFRKERAESGRRGASNRWGNSSAIAQPLAKSKTANAKDSIGKDRKGQDIIKTSKEVGETPKTFGNEEINKTLEAIRLKVGIDDFADAQKWKRIYGQHCLNLLKKIGSQEFSRRLDIILNDSFKHKRCNQIKYIYEEVKGFIEPQVKSIKSF